MTHRAGVTERPRVSRSRQGHQGTLRLLLVLCVVLAGSACRSLFNGGARTPNPKGTISGTVRGPDNGRPVGPRSVRAIDTATGKRYSTRLNDVGDYTFLLPPGRYRIEFTLRRGEAIAQQPDPISIGGADMKVDVDLVLTHPEIAKPR